MRKLADLLDRIKGTKALIVGDLMLDEYIFGRATRISPEAPVMVVQQTRTQFLPGGAANVALNVLALDGQASVVGVVGDDSAGATLTRALKEKGIDGDGLVRDPRRSTTRKTRVLADAAHQVLRIDHEDEEPVSREIEDGLLDKVLNLIDGAQVLLMSDYLKGALSPRLIQESIGLARDRRIPVVANPKPRSVRLYRGSQLVSLNRAEASEALEKWRPISDQEALEAARCLREKLGVDAVMITLGESGMAIAGEASFRIDAPRVEVFDTAGAGDTVIATVALGVAAEGLDPAVFRLAAQTSASVVRHVGVATPSREDLGRIRGIEEVS